jgi:flagellar biosynthesis protein FlhG
MKPLAEQDYYETLDVARGAGFDEIERAYRLACATYTEDSLAGYPVFEVGDVEVLRERIEIAYRILADPDTRRAYDVELSSVAPPPAPARAVAASAAVASHAVEVRRSEPVLAPLDAALDELEESEGDWTGARLRRTRLRQGLEIEDITRITKVNPTYLAFIEEERFDGLPAAVYVRGFVTGYAGCLGLDAKRVAASYLQRCEESKGAAKRRLFSRK